MERTLGHDPDTGATTGEAAGPAGPVGPVPPLVPAPRVPHHDRMPGRPVLVLALLDLAVLGWMVLAGAWLDRRAVLSLLTLGGHHDLVAALAAGALVLLVVGSALISRPIAAGAVFVLAAVLTLVAVGGLLALAVLILLLAVFAGLLLKLSWR